MRKGIAVLAAAIVLSVAGCGNSKQLEADNASLQAENESLQTEKESLKVEKESLVADKNNLEVLIYGTSAAVEDNGKAEETSDANAETKEETTAANVNDNQFSFGQPVTVDDITEFTLTGSEWQTQVNPSNTSGMYSYYPGNDGETYLIFRGTLKNLATEAIDSDDVIDAELLVNGKYKFPVHIACEEPDGTSFYGNPKPLQTLNMAAFASISNEVKDQFSHGVLTVNVLTDTSKLGYIVDVEEEKHETFVMSFDLN